MEAPDLSEVLVLKNFDCKYKKEKKVQLHHNQSSHEGQERTEPSITMINSDIIGIIFQKAAKH